MTKKRERSVFGLELGRVFYRTMVRPVLDRRFPGVPHSAGIIGGGSETLGFDDRMSRDHNWGPRVMIFLRPADMRKSGRMKKVLADELPSRCLGYPVGFSDPDPADKGVQRMRHDGSGPVNHRVEFMTISGFFRGDLGLDIGKDFSVADWLSLPWQKLAAATGGEIFHDGIGLENARKKLRAYPRDVLLYLMAAVWRRIGQEEHLTGRAAIVGDEIGSRIIASRLVRDIMNLCFLLEGRYPPYPKWFGTAFGRLACGPRLKPVLAAVLSAATWKGREKHLMNAMATVAKMHDALGLAPPIPRRPSKFWGRPFRVFRGETIAGILLGAIGDPGLKRRTGARLLGGIDTISDSTDLLCGTGVRRKIRDLLGP